MSMKKYLLCAVLLCYSGFLYAQKNVWVYDELVKITIDIYVKFYKVNNRIPTSFDDFMENLPRRQDFNERNTRGLIDLFMNEMGWKFTYVKIDENNFELSIQDGNKRVMYQSKNDMILYYEDGIQKINDYCGIKARYLNSSVENN